MIVPVVVPAAPQAALPWRGCRDGWSARRAAGSSTGRSSSFASASRLRSPPLKDAGALVDGVAGEQEGPEDVAHLRHQIGGRGARDLVEHRARRIEHLRLVLREVAERDVVADDAFAVVERLDAGEQLHQRRLAGAVRADERHPAAAFDGHVEPVVDDEVAELLARAAQLQHDPPAARRLREAEVHAAEALGRLRGARSCRAA